MAAAEMHELEAQDVEFFGPLLFDLELLLIDGLNLKLAVSSSRSMASGGGAAHLVASNGSDSFRCVDDAAPLWLPL